MRIGNIEIRRRVWVGLIFVIAATGIWVAWSRSQARAAAAVALRKQPFVQLAGSGPGAEDQALLERAEYFDPTPLFFPTRWNFGQSAHGESTRKEPGEVFGRIGAKLTFAEQNIKTFNAEVTPMPEHLYDVLGPGDDTPFAGFGHVDEQRPALAERGGFLEIRSLIDDEIVAEQVLVGLKVPTNDFAPLEFLVAVSSSGLVGEPVLMSGSGLEEVDTFMHRFLVKTFRLGARLSPGRYRVLIGP